MKHIVKISFALGLAFLFSCNKQETATPDPLNDIIDLPISVIGDGNIILNNPVFQLFTPNLAAGYGGYGFASLIETEPNHLLVTCTRYKSFGDFIDADIVARKSEDNGRSWSKEYLIQENIGAVNTLCPALLKITNNHLMLFFCVKTSYQESEVRYKESVDGGNTWNAPKLLNVGLKGYYTMANDRALYNKNRIIYPVGFTPVGQAANHHIICFYSDDLGKTWKKSNTIKAPFSLTEPCVAQLNETELLMCIRTSNGFVYFSRSYDNGATWKTLVKTNIQTPEAPQTILQLGRDTLVIAWNNTPYSDGHENRSPLTIAYSVDKGNSWKGATNLQQDKSFNYFYPTLAKSSNDSLLITYGIRRKTTYNPSVYFEKLSIRNLFK